MTTYLAVDDGLFMSRSTTQSVPGCYGKSPYIPSATNSHSMRLFISLFVTIFILLLMSCAADSPLEPQVAENLRTPQVKETPAPLASPEAERHGSSCDRQIWNGTVGGKSLLWTTDDVFLKKGERYVGLFKESAAKMHRAGVAVTLSNLRSIGQRQSSRGLSVKSSAAVEIISVVDPYVTFQVESLSFLEGYPGLHETWWLTLDMSKTNDPEPFSSPGAQNFDVDGMADLRTLFSSDELFDAISRNPRIVQAFNAEGDIPYSELLKKWLGRGADTGKIIERIPVGEGLSLLEYSFQHFVFDRLEGNSVVIKMALVNLAASDSYTNDFIEISLPLTPDLQSSISSASNGQNGFLVANRENVTKGCVSSIDFSTKL